MRATHTIALYYLLPGVGWSVDAADIQCGSHGCDSTALEMVLLQNRHQLGTKASARQEADHLIGQPVRQNIQVVLEQEADAVNKSNGTSLQKSLFVQLEYELKLSQDPPSKNKLILALIEVLLLGVLGIDRCYMGQVLLGSLKGVTCGGFIIWAVIDYFVVGYYALMKTTSIGSFGYHAKFDQGAVEPAFWVFVLLLAFKVCGFYGHASRRKSKE